MTLEPAGVHDLLWLIGHATPKFSLTVPSYPCQFYLMVMREALKILLICQGVQIVIRIFPHQA